jgi:Flp pilus assembly protein TadB
MTAALAVAAGVLLGIHWPTLVLVSLSVWEPWAAAALVLLLVIGARHRESGAGAEVRFVEAVIGELRAGSSLRRALRVACGEIPDAGGVLRRLDVGEPLPRAIRGLARRLPTVGELVEAAVAADGGGGRMLPLFEELLIKATADEAARAEMRAALAPVRASMTVLVGGPVVYLVWSAATGRLGRLLAMPGGVYLTLGGGVVFALGVLAMLWMARPAQ